MIKTGNNYLDSFLDIKEKNLIIIYGPPASGKTTFCLLVSKESAKNSKVIFFDTEKGFSTERFNQIANNSLLENILILRPSNLKDQTNKIENLKFIKNIGLVIIDTLTYFYRKNIKDDYCKANYLINKQLNILKEISKNTTVIITSQVYSGLDGTINISGGKLVKNFSDFLIELKKDPRMICLLKPEKRELKFEIKEKGFEIESFIS